MAVGADWEDEEVLLEDVDRLGPASHSEVSLFSGGDLLPVPLVGSLEAGVEDRGEDMYSVSVVRRQDLLLEVVEVEVYDGVVEVLTRLQALEVSNNNAVIVHKHWTSRLP